MSCALLVEVFDCNEEVNGVSDVKHDCGKCRCCEGLGWEGLSLCDRFAVCEDACTDKPGI